MPILKTAMPSPLLTRVYAKLKAIIDISTQILRRSQEVRRQILNLLFRWFKSNRRSHLRWWGNGSPLGYVPRRRRFDSFTSRQSGCSSVVERGTSVVPRSCVQFAPLRQYCGVEQLAARQLHKLEAAGSSPAPASKCTDSSEEEHRTFNPGTRVRFPLDAPFYRGIVQW